MAEWEPTVNHTHGGGVDRSPRRPAAAAAATAVTHPTATTYIQKTVQHVGGAETNAAGDILFSLLLLRSQHSSKGTRKEYANKPEEHDGGGLPGRGLAKLDDCSLQSE